MGYGITDTADESAVCWVETRALYIYITYLCCFPPNNQPTLRLFFYFLFSCFLLIACRNAPSNKQTNTKSLRTQTTIFVGYIHFSLAFHSPIYVRVTGQAGVTKVKQTIKKEEINEQYPLRLRCCDPKEIDTYESKKCTL